MRHIKSEVFIFLFVIVLFVSGCATTQERLLDSDSSQVQLRSIQTRTFDTTDKEKTLRTIMATLQDLDFVIDQADSVLGTVTATKLNRYALRLTASVRPKGEGQTLVRVNCQYENRPVYDPEPYQKFFASLDKAMFLSTHYETSSQESNKKVTKSGTKKNVTSQESPQKEPSPMMIPNTGKTLHSHDALSNRKKAKNDLPSLFDGSTGLTWTIVPSKIVDYGTAQSFCKSLKTEQTNGHRVPSLEEFEQLWERYKDDEGISVFNKKEYTTKDEGPYASFGQSQTFSFESGTTGNNYTARLVCVDK